MCLASQGRPRASGIVGDGYGVRWGRRWYVVGVGEVGMELGDGLGDHLVGFGCGGL